MSKFEVTNLQYRNFLSEASVGMTAEEKNAIACDTLAWTAVKPYGEYMKNHYFSLPAYNNFPVVNISYFGAAKYCEWLQQRLQKANPEVRIEVRLPSKEEWIWAGMGGRGQAMFPWSDYYLRDAKGKPMCNYKKVNEFAIHRNKTTGKPEVSEQIADFSGNDLLTMQVNSFSQNDFGLYNMCGNAAEMVAEKGIGMGGSWDDYAGDVHLRAQSN